MRKHSFLSCSEQDNRTVPITDARNLSSSPHSNTLHLPMECWDRKKCSEKAFRTLNKPHRYQLVCSNMNFLFKESYETAFLSQGFTRPVTPISMSHQRRPWLTIYFLSSIKVPESESTPIQPGYSCKKETALVLHRVRDWIIFDN